MKNMSNNLEYRKSGLVNNIDFIIDTLEQSKMDILYIEKLRMPLTSDEKVYFLQQIDRLNSATKILLWIRKNILSNETFWKKLLRW